jgi:hypothetical protein
MLEGSDTLRVAATAGAASPAVTTSASEAKVLTLVILSRASGPISEIVLRSGLIYVLLFSTGLGLFPSLDREPHSCPSS